MNMFRLVASLKHPSANTPGSRSRLRPHCATALWAVIACFAALPAAAQQGPLQPGEAFVTRFSGVAPQSGSSAPAISVSGAVGSIIDLRAPGQPPRGEHWMDEPQRNPVTAGDVGQVFGVVLDDATPPNIYISATSAFGLHLTPGTGQWMAGMWGRGGGPSTIYRLDAANNYRPRVLASVTLGGRQNTGAALGNMAFDRINKQIFVSDLETGMIHRINAANGADLGYFDHGVQGRSRFVDVRTKQQMNLPPIAFNPGSRAQIADCRSGPFERSPECWNFAASGRRVWGTAIRRDPYRNEVRLYYAVWSSPAFGQTVWNVASDDDKRNSVWSVRLSPDGSFDTSDVRREFLLPDFFAKKEDIARAGYSQPVSDITFSECDAQPVMLLAERGGIRNLGLAAENAFAFPHEARALRYELDQAGSWQPVGRYDVGYYDRKNEGQPHLRANCAGGIAFGFGYTADYSTIDPSKPDQFLWISGDALCSTESPCRAPPGVGVGDQPSGQPAPQPTAARPGQQTSADASEVHGVQGMPENAVDALVPAAAFSPYPQSGEPYPAIGPDQSYMIDTDLNIDQSGTPIEAEFIRNDATRIGDIAIYMTCAPPPMQPALLLPPPPPEAIGVVPIIEGHDPVLTHAEVASHGAMSSHFRFASHNPWFSHDRVRSHNRWRSHNVVLSDGWHRPVGSLHRPPGSIHRPPGSVHRPPGSVHRPPGSLHRPPGSIHRPPGSIHRPPGSIHRPPGSIHRPPGSVHRPPGSVHRPPGSVHRPPGSVHRPPGSVHRPPGSVVRRSP
jgi:hypothetical protein